MGKSNEIINKIYNIDQSVLNEARNIASIETRKLQTLNVRINELKNDTIILDVIKNKTSHKFRRKGQTRRKSIPILDYIFKISYDLITYNYTRMKIPEKLLL